MKRFPLPPILFYLSIIGMSASCWLLPRIIEKPYHLTGIPMLALGVIIACAGRWQFRKVGTNIKTFSAPDTMVTDGLFRYSRNPMYVGIMTALAGVAVITGTVAGPILFALFFLAMARVYIPHEETRMQQSFGDKYTQYTTRVRRWI